MIYPSSYGEGIDDDALSHSEWQTRRYLRVVNDTGEKLEIHVQYRTETSDGQFAWFPADPESSDQSVAYDLDPGEATFLGQGNGKMNASRVRIWAISESGKKYVQMKDQDLWLVPEMNGEERCYSAPEMQTFVLAFAP
jgi:hypothetical protein